VAPARPQALRVPYDDSGWRPVNCGHTPSSVSSAVVVGASDGRACRSRPDDGDVVVVSHDGGRLASAPCEGRVPLGTGM